MHKVLISGNELTMWIQTIKKDISQRRLFPTNISLRLWVDFTQAEFHTSKRRHYAQLKSADCINLQRSLVAVTLHTFSKSCDKVSLRVVRKILLCGNQTSTSNLQLSKNSFRRTFFLFFTAWIISLIPKNS